MSELLHTGLAESRRAARMLWRNPAFTLSVLSLLTITIGAVTSLGGAAYELLNGSLPYGRANELAMVWSDLPKSAYSRAPLSGPELFDLRERSRTFKDLAAITSTTTTLGGLQDPLQIPIGNVTHNFFSVLQVSPQLGRTFSENDEGPGKAPTIILSWSLWKNQFGGDRAIVGRKITLNGVETEVVGVMPADFRMEFAPDANISVKTDAWVPFNSDLRAGNRFRYFLRVVGRLQEGTTAEAASKEMVDIGDSLEREFVGYASSGRKLFAVGIGADLAKPVKVSALALGLAGLFLVLLCFVNISGLWVAHNVRRRHEHSICQILGASVTRLRNQTILQAVMLSAAGCVLGIEAGRLGLAGLRAIRPPSLARIDHATLSWPIILGVLVIVIVSTLFLALVSWSSVAALDPSEVSGARVSSAPRYRLRAALVVVQVGLTLVFLVSSALWMRTFLKVMQTDLGFQPQEATTFRYSINPLGLKDDEQVSAINQRLSDAVGSIPGVEAAGSISHLPFDHLPNWSMSYWTEASEKDLTREADVRAVSPGFLSAIGARIHSGRFFQETDNINAPPVIVVDRLLAERTWPREDPIGQKLFVKMWTSFPPVTFTVIGVLDHVRYRSIENQVREQMYVPVRQYPDGPYSLIVRSSLDSNALNASIRQKVREVDSRIPIWDVRTLKSYHDDAAAERSFAAILLAIFAAAALLLASIGVFGLLTYIVAGRQGEFGIRMALGASPGQIVYSVLRESLVWAVIGVVITGAVFFPIATKLSGALYGVTPHDPLSWALSIVILLSVIAVASWMPAFRASRTDPAMLMRNQ